MGNLLEDLLPSLPPGNPGDVARRRREARIQEALDAQPPVTFAPLVPWGPGERADACLRSHDYEGLTRLAVSLPVLDRHLLVRRLGETLDRDEAVAWADAEARNALAQLALAASLQHRAWLARGNDQTPGELAETAFDDMSFDAYLGWSAELCERAVKLDPERAVVPLVLAQYATYTTVVTRDDVLAAARRWQAIDPLDVFGLRALITELTPGGVGRPDDVLTVATTAHEAAPDGHPAHAGVPRALIQMCAAASTTATAAEASQVFRDHRALLEEAYARSLGSPAWQSSVLDGPVRNAFCFALFFADSDDLAWREMQLLRGHALADPWALRYGDAADGFADARAWLVRHVAERD